MKDSKDGTPIRKMAVEWLHENGFIKEIIAEWLHKNGYDGLCNPFSECGCGFDDLMPCCCPSELECVCAYKILDPDEPEYPIYVVSDGVSTYEAQLLCEKRNSFSLGGDQ